MNHPFSPPRTGFEATATHDALGNILTSTDEDGNTATFSYDGRNRLIEEEYKKPGGVFWAKIVRTYDAVGALRTVTSKDSLGAAIVSVEYFYAPASGADPHTGELRKVEWQLGGTLWKTLEYDYDSDGRRTQTQVSDESGVRLTQTFEYDAAGRLKEIKHGGVAKATFDYQHGMLVKTTLGNGNTIHRVYDKKARLKTLKHKNGGALIAQIDYAYDSRDRRTSAYYGHLNLLSEFEYNQASWLTHEEHSQPSSGPTFTNEERPESRGNKSARTASATATPAAAASTVDVDIDYDYDLRGNRITKTVNAGPWDSASYVFDLDDRLTSETRGASSITYSWANRGNLLGKTVTGPTPESTAYYADYAGRIVTVSTSADTWSYLFAPTGDRIGKWKASAPTVNEWQLPDGGDVICDYEHVTGTPDTFTGAYVSPGIDGRLGRVDGSGDWTYTFGDALQSVHQVTSATGAVLRATFTDAWGNDIQLGPTPPPATGPGDRYGFQGREKDLESGLQHFRARSYDPLTGRFTSRDPVWHSNLYNYCGNDPIQHIDPSGLDRVFMNGDKVIWEFGGWGDYIDLGNAVGGDIHWGGGKVSIEELKAAAKEEDTAGWESNSKRAVIDLTLRRLKRELDVDDAWVMAIHSNSATGDETDQGATGGHAWITLHNEKTNEIVTYGVWADFEVSKYDPGRAEAPGGVQVDYGPDKRIGQYYHAQRISGDEKKRFDEYIDRVGPNNKGGGAKSWSPDFSCAGFAVEAFADATGVEMFLDILNIDTPRSVGQFIRIHNGGSDWPQPGGAAIPDHDYRLTGDVGWPERNGAFAAANPRRTLLTLADPPEDDSSCSGSK